MIMATSTPAATLRDFTGTLVLVGAGKMGGAMLESWIALGLDAKRIAVIEPQPSGEVAALRALGLTLNPDEGAVTDPSVIVLAVKPQSAPDVLPAVRPMTGVSTLVLSIMAGRTLAFLQQGLPGAAIVRVMPNTPASIGRGIAVAVANGQVSSAQRGLADRLLAATGAVEWVTDEKLMDAVTALSGSGPAYVFLLAESLAKAGVAAGLPPDLAARLARATVTGSGELLHRSPLDAARLRENVTSPGGTTAAALDVLMAKDGLDPLLEKAIAAATRRSRELKG
jgi:pyrroline-5-carboxylate reductase